MDKIENEIYKDINNNNKLIKILLLLLISIIIIIFASIYLYLNHLVTPTITEINLAEISDEEKEMIKDINFLELNYIPNTIEFISLKLESTDRESQFCIKFSVDKNDASKTIIERNSSEKVMKITKLFENNNVEFYEAKTHFISHTKNDKWTYLYELIKKYKK